MCVCLRVCAWRQMLLMEVNQVSLELSHAALSLSGDHVLRAGRGRVSSRSSLLRRTRFAYVCVCTCAFVNECWHAHCRKNAQFGMIIDSVLILEICESQKKICLSWIQFKLQNNLFFIGGIWLILCFMTTFKNVFEKFLFHSWWHKSWLIKNAVFGLNMRLNGFLYSVSHTGTTTWCYIFYYCYTVQL